MVESQMHYNDPKTPRLEVASAPRGLMQSVICRMVVCCQSATGSLLILDVRTDPLSWSILFLPRLIITESGQFVSSLKEKKAGERL